MAPWAAEAFKGKPINEYWLAHRLRPYGIRSKTLWIENDAAKEYLHEDFYEIWRRYVPKSKTSADVTVEPAAREAEAA